MRHCRPAVRGAAAPFFCDSWDGANGSDRTGGVRTGGTPVSRGTGAPRPASLEDGARGASGASGASGAPYTCRVSLATGDDLPFVVALQKANGQALGFIPRLALAQKIDLGQVLVARVGGTLAGFLHHGSLRRPEVRIFQAAVVRGGRRRGVGAALLRRLLRRAEAAGAAGASCRCLSFLPANQFWAAAGFTIFATEPGAKGTLHVWVKRFGAGAGPTPFPFASRVRACPGCGAGTVGTWVRGARRLALCPNCVAAAGRN